MTITLITPTYNRAHLLPRLYESLISQTDYSFEWIVIDDGSADNTKVYMESLLQIKNPFPIDFESQHNGGKHRAINRAVSLASGRWILILDSDDWLSNDAISSIKKRCKEIEKDESFGSITGLRVTPNLETIGTECDYQTLDSDFFEYRYKYKIVGDRAEVVRKDVLREFPFPEFEGENFLGEAVVWNAISQKYKTRFTNDKFYICDYQEGGLTDTFNKKSEENPLGSIANILSVMKHPKCPIKYWLFYNRLYFKFYKIAKKKSEVIPYYLKPTDRMRMLSVLNYPLNCAYKIYRFVKRNNEPILRLLSL